MVKAFNTPGQRLKEFRNGLGLTQDELAKKLGLAGYQVRDMESGKVEISLSMAKLLHYVVLVSESWLLEGVEPRINIDTLIKNGRIPDPDLAESPHTDTRSEAIDTSLLKEIVEAVEELFEKESLSLPPKKKAELIALIYEDIATEKTPIDALKGRVVRLVKLAS